MLIGGGLIASAFRSRYADDPRITIYCAGVSNSLEADHREFMREESLLASELEKSRGRSRFVYFGTCSAAAPPALHTPYIRHKLAMEARIREHPDHVIFRLPQVAGFSPNPHTLLNHLFRKIRLGEPFELWLGSHPNIIDGEDAFRLCSKILDQTAIANQIINIANPRSCDILTLVELISDICGRSPMYTPVDKGYALEIDVTVMAAFLAELQISFDEDYLRRTLKKYYSQPATAAAFLPAGTRLIARTE